MRKRELLEILQRLPGAIASFTRWTRGVQVLLSDSRSEVGARRDPNSVSEPGAASSNTVASRLAEADSRAGHPTVTTYDSQRRISRLGAVAVDPWCIFVFWNIEVARLAQVRYELGEPQAPIFLRTYDITLIDFDGTNAHQYIEQRVDAAHARCYIRLPAPERSVCCELVVKSSAQREESLARSNFVQLSSATERAADAPQFAAVNPSRVSRWLSRQQPLRVARSESPQPGATETPAAATADRMVTEAEMQPIRDGTVGDESFSESLPLWSGAYYGSIGVSSGEVIDEKKHDVWIASEPSSVIPSSTSLSSWGRRRGKRTEPPKES